MKNKLQPILMLAFLLVVLPAIEVLFFQPPEPTESLGDYSIFDLFLPCAVTDSDPERQSANRGTNLPWLISGREF